MCRVQRKILGGKGKAGVIRTLTLALTLTLTRTPTLTPALTLALILTLQALEKDAGPEFMEIAIDYAEAMRNARPAWSKRPLGSAPAWLLRLLAALDSSILP